jgi:hypothetical protein
MNNLGGNEKFLQILNSADIKTIHSGEATLEDILLKLQEGHCYEVVAGHKVRYAFSV